MDLNKLKVPELRKELQNRGLDSKGNKPVLIERLREALEKEAENEEESDNEEVEESSEENSAMYTTAEGENTTPSINANNEDVFTAVRCSESEEQGNTSIEVTDEKQNVDEDVPSATTKQTLEGTEVVESKNTPETYDDDNGSQQIDDSENMMLIQEAGKSKDAVSEAPQTTDKDYAQSNDSSQSYGCTTSQETSETNPISKNKEEVRNLNEETMDVAESADSSVGLHENQDAPNTFSSQNFINQEAIQNEEPRSTTMDEEITSCEVTTEQEVFDQKVQGEEISTEKPLETQGTMEEHKKRTRKSRFDQPNERYDQSEEVSSNRPDEDRKRKHSPSPSCNDAAWSGCEVPAKMAKEDDEPHFSDEAVLLSWYDSDLNLTISKEDFLAGVPLNDQGFMYMWAGARSTYGFQCGKVYYDVKLIEKLHGDLTEELEIHSFRLGWSVVYSSLQLGDVRSSYGYDSAGKKCEDGNFSDYGQPFNTEDIIGCLVDFETHEEKVLLSYTLNGVDQGIAFEIPKIDLEGKALFPHILTKNISFEVNFGEREDGWNSKDKFQGDFEWASQAPLANRVKGPRKPDEKKQCEVVMLCGLPCSGKTMWVKKHIEEFPEKMYNVIGIDSVLNRMKLLDESIEIRFRKKDNVNNLVEKCTRCMNRLIELACIRWRNYILDQCNTFLAVQRRKMRTFEGFTRIAVVTLPKEEDYEKYLEKWNENCIRETSISLLEHKSNFRLPEEGELFEQVLFEGTTREEAETLIKKYNKEGRDARQRDDRGFNRGGFYRDDRYGRPLNSGSGGYRSRWMDRGLPSMGRGGWGPRGGMDRMSPGGFRDRRHWRDRDDDRDGYRGGRYGPRDHGGRFGGGSGVMGGGRWGPPPGGRDRDRMGPMSRGPPGSGPNPLMGSLVGKPGSGPMGYGGERKNRFDDKRDGDDFDRSVRMAHSGADPEDDSMDKGGGRFSDSSSGFRGGPRGGFRGGRGGGLPDRSIDRGVGGSRFGGGGGFRPNNGAGPRGGSSFNRNRDDGSGRFYGGRGGGPVGRDGRDNRNPMNHQQRPSPGGPNDRFDKRDGGKGNGNKNEPNSANPQPQQPSSWGAYNQANWNQQYQQWAQYQQQAGYNPQQIQQYWAQMQQQQQQQQSQNTSSAQSTQQASKMNAGANASSNSLGTPSTTAQSSANSNTSSTQQAGSNAGYSTSQAYSAGTPGYNQQGYDANAYAQYCAYYSQLAAQQGWPQNADGTYTYPQNAWAQYGYGNYNATAGTSNASGASSTASANTGGATEKATVTSK